MLLDVEKSVTKWFLGGELNVYKKDQSVYQECVCVIKCDNGFSRLVDKKKRNQTLVNKKKKNNIDKLCELR